MSCFALFGGYALHLQRSGAIDLVHILQTGGREKTLMTLLETLPMPPIITALYLIMIFIFLATTIDSAVYILASVCTVRLSGNEQPAKWNRMLWAIILMLFSLGLIMVGGLQTVQTASIAVGFPLIFVTVILMISVTRMIHKHEQNATVSQPARHHSAA